MTELPITNCHIHLFTADHVPNGFLPFGLMRILKKPFIRTPLIKALRQGIFWRDGDIGERAARFAQVGGEVDQRDIFTIIRRYYPEKTRFVVLPMDMAYMKRGSPDEDLPAQHDRLAEIAGEFEGTIIPFTAVDPRRPKVLDELKRCTEELGFKGIKLYPPLGYAPDDKVLMEDIYPYCVEKNLPVMTHCSRGGVREKNLTRERQAQFAGPKAFIPVLEEFPLLRVCLAHFGGESEWNDYLGHPHLVPRPEERSLEDTNWLAQILELLRSGKFKNLWTDISYTVFNFRQNVPALHVFLSDKKVLDRVLFGSDFYMTEIEGASEKRVSIELRYGIGEANFQRIAKINPVAYLDGPGTPG